METINSNHEQNLKKIRDHFRKIVSPGVVVNGEFIANTMESKDYLAFVYLTNIRGLGTNKVYSCGISLTDLHNSDACISKIKASIVSENLAFIWK